MSYCTCGGCERKFSCLSAFEKHRAGRYADNTRHCLTDSEMRDAGLVLNHTGRWSLNQPKPGYWKDIEPIVCIAVLMLAYIGTLVGAALTGR